MLGTKKTGSSDPATLITDLEENLKLDRLYICREILHKLDASPSPVVTRYFADNAEKIFKLRSNIDKCHELMASLNSPDGWTKAGQKKDVAVYFKKYDDDAAMHNGNDASSAATKTGNSNLLETKLESFFPGEPQDLPRLFVKLIALFAEIDMLPRWFPRNLMKSAELIQEPSNFSRLARFGVGLPVPVNLIIGPREAHVFGHGFDLSEESKAMVLATTMQEGEVVNGFKIPAPQKGNTQMQLQSAFYFEMKRNGLVFKSIMMVDINSMIVPSFLMNMITKGILPFELMAGIRKQIANFDGSEWDKRVQANPKVYGDIEQRMWDYMQREFGVTPQPLNLDGKDEKEGDDDWETMSARFSVTSTGRKKKGKMRKLAKKVSDRISVKRSPSGRRYSVAAKRSVAHLDKVELYDFPIRTENELRAEREERRRAAAPAGLANGSSDKGMIAILLFYLVLFMVRVAEVLGQKAKLVEINPSLVNSYPSLFKEFN